MSSLYEELRANFYRWEQRGRGVDLFLRPVELEPPFAPFPGHRVRFESAGRDAGVRTTLLSRLADKAFRSLQPPKSGALAVTQRVHEETEGEAPNWYEEKESVIEIGVRLPCDVACSREAMAQFLTTLGLVSGIIGLEVIGTADSVFVQLVCQPDEVGIVAEQMKAHFPEVKLSCSEGNLLQFWESDDESERLVLDFGLHSEFMRPLETGGRVDPFVSLIGGMSRLTAGETAVYQVLFSPLRAPWAENVMAAVTRENGRPFFDDGADLVKQAQTKVSRPLYCAALRLAAKADSFERAWGIVRGLAPALRHFSREGGQSLMPLPNTGYDDEVHCDDLVWRRSRRCGMILNLDELVGLVHWPSPAVRSEKLARAPDGTSRPAPKWSEEALTPGSLVLGANVYDGETTAAVLYGEQRLAHLHVIGGSGTGKSTLLLSLLTQDLKCDRGFALLDPHGDLADAVLSRVPEERLGDVVIIDPSDEQYITPFNVLSAHSDYEKTLLASDLVSVFRRLSTSWGDRMNIIFQNLVLVFLEHGDGGTLADMRRFLVDINWRNSFLTGVYDQDVQFYWRETFPKLDGPKSVGPILTRLETLLTPKVIRYMVSQRENRLDFNEIMDEGRILIVRLPMGQIGRENAFMLGSLVMVKLQQAAMARAHRPVGDRRPFYAYVDEAQHFVTPGMAEILAGARKYGLGLVLAHQDLHQLSQNADVAAAVMTNAATRIVFRVSESDARVLKADFAHYEPGDFASLGRGEAICRIERADQDFNLRVIRPDDVSEFEAAERRMAAIHESRSRYTIPREQVEAELRLRMSGSAAANLDPSREQTCATPGDPNAFVESPSIPAESEDPATDAEPEPQKPVEAQPPSLPKQAPSVSDHRMLGKGGNQHRTVQERIKLAAESKGFRAILEMAVGTGNETVDVGLVRDGMRIACEISVTTTIDHEVGNARKCLRERFDVVVLIRGNRHQLAQLADAVQDHLDPDEAARVKCFTPEEAVSFIECLPEVSDPKSRPNAPESVRRGIKVRRKFSAVGAAERSRQFEAAFQLLVEEMKLPPPSS